MDWNYCSRKREQQLKKRKKTCFLDFDKTYIRTLEHWLTHHFKNVKRHVKYVAKLKFGTLGRIIS